MQNCEYLYFMQNFAQGMQNVAITMQDVAVILHFVDYFLPKWYN